MPEQAGAGVSYRWEQDVVDNRDTADDVDIGWATQVVHAGLLNSAFHAVTGVADQHLDGVGVMPDVVDHRSGGVLVGDVVQEPAGGAHA
jgi:hypothetical protein